MVEIESCRGNIILKFKNWKSYAKFLSIEVSQLQQLIKDERRKLAFEGAVNKAKHEKIPFEIIGEK